MYWRRSRFNSDYDFVSKENKNQEAFIALVRAGLWEDSQKFGVEGLELGDSSAGVKKCSIKADHKYFRFYGQNSRNT